MEIGSGVSSGFRVRYTGLRSKSAQFKKKNWYKKHLLFNQMTNVIVPDVLKDFL